MEEEIVNSDSPAGVEEEKEASVEEILEEGKETPSELPADDSPDTEAIPPAVEDTSRELEGIRKQRDKLLAEVTLLRDQRREIKEPLMKNQPIDDLSGLHPADVEVVEKILKARGYVTKQEASSMLYENVKREQIDSFLEKYPEYKPENDPDSINWNALNRELEDLRMPSDPKRIETVLTKAHNLLERNTRERGNSQAEHKIQTARTGSGGIAQRSSSQSSLKASQVEELRRGGWSEEEIKELQNKE